MLRLTRSSTALTVAVVAGASFAVGLVSAFGADASTRPAPVAPVAARLANSPGGSFDPAIYGGKTPYAPKGSLAGYHAPPAGFTPFYTEMIARHGSRAASDGSDVLLVEEAISQAQAAHQAHPSAARLLTQLQSLDTAMTTLGFGMLSGRGRQEHAAMGDRLAQRLPSLFADAAANGRHIAVVNSGIARAVDSGTAFVGGLEAADPALTPLVDPAVTDKDTVYFHKAKINAAYQTWKDTDPTLLAKLDKLTYSAKSQSKSVNALKKIFTADFIAKLTAGQVLFTNPDDPTGPKVSRNAIDVAFALYHDYTITAGLSAEGTWTFRPFVPDDVARHFTYVDDMIDFYTKGPSFAGSTITFTMAKILLDNFFSSIEAVRTGTSTEAARLRFAHAETMIPLAALMQLPGSQVQVPATKDFSFAHNPWRTSKVAPYAANMQWDVFRNATGTVLVRMLYNEKETRFKAGCAPTSSGSYFYDLTELRRCYGYNATLPAAPASVGHA